MSESLLQQYLRGCIFHEVHESLRGYEVVLSKQFLEQPGNVCKTKKHILLLDKEFKPMGTFELPSNAIFRHCHPKKDIVIVGIVEVDKGCAKKKNAVLEIIKDGIDIHRKELAGYCDFYADFQFASPNPWFKNKFVFVAERYSECVNEYQETFGEKFIGKSDPVLGIYDLGTDEIKFVEGLEDVYPMSSSFLNVDTLVVQSYSKNELKLGMVYCLNRPTQIVLFELATKKSLTISNPELSARSPRVVNGKVYYLQGPIYASHYSAAQVIEYDFTTKTTNFLADDHFEEALKPHCDANQLFMNPSVGFSLPIKTSDRILDEHGELLSVCGNVCFFKKSTIKCFPSLHAIIKDGRNVCITCEEALPEMNLIEEELIVRSPTFEILYYKKQGNTRLIMIPHGGPNCSTSNLFSVESNFFLASGYDVALINYTGSAGYGQASIDKLVIGENDIEDNLQAALYFKPKYEKLFIYGGSHGGAIIATMLGKYPDLFNAAALVNPTIDLPSMAVISDIPDWCFGQFRQHFELNNVYEMTQVLSQVSSGRYSKDIKSPVLLLLGGNDCRVPPTQGLFWKKICVGKDFTLKYYDDSDHSLDSEKSFFDVPLQVISFFDEKCKR